MCASHGVRNMFLRNLVRTKFMLPNLLPHYLQNPHIYTKHRNSIKKTEHKLEFDLMYNFSWIYLKPINENVHSTLECSKTKLPLVTRS